MAEDPEEKLLAEETIGEVKEKAAGVQELRRSKTKLNERRVFNEVEEQEETGIEDCFIEKMEGPGKVIVLADTTCRYAGEWRIISISHIHTHTGGRTRSCSRTCAIKRQFDRGLRQRSNGDSRKHQ